MSEHEIAYLRVPLSNLHGESVVRKSFDRSGNVHVIFKDPGLWHVTRVPINWLTDYPPEKHEFPHHGTQVGGHHYKGLWIQPQEFADLNRYSPSAFAVLKYLTRWRHAGKGLQDLLKARQFVRLRMETEAAALQTWRLNLRAANNLDKTISISDYITFNRPWLDDLTVIALVDLNQADMGFSDWSDVRQSVDLLIEREQAKGIPE